VKAKLPVACRALLVDLDGVLRLWPSHDSELERMYELPTGALRKVAFESILSRRAITGQISDEVWRQEILRQLQQNHPSGNARKAVEAWSAATGVVNQPVLGLIRLARNYVKIVLVTNATSRLTADLEALGLASEFDAIVNSSVVGKVKPEEQIYRAALESVGVRPEEALFVDDTKANAEAARRMGLRALHFQDPDGLSQFLIANQVFRKEA
jgi:HAD superfamily hydrolase (TIGR01509 family)